MTCVRKFGLGVITTSLIMSYALSANAASSDRSQLTVEVLHGISVEPELLSIDVLSTGCTSADDFKFDVRKRKTGVELTVFRVRPDLCKAISHNVTLTFKRSAIGLDGVDTFALRNEFRGFPRFAF